MSDTTINFVATFKGGAATAAANSFKHALHGLHGTVGNVAGKLKDLGLMMTKLALGAGIALAGLFALSAKRADEYGITVARVTKITGLSIEASSRLVAVFQRYGVEGTDAIRTIGMMEKNVGKLTQTVDKAAKFQAAWGFSLLDANHHVKDANTLIGQAADYFNNKHIPASKKAAFEASLFGRNWQQIVPILALGSKGIKAAADEADKLGLVLNKHNAGSLAAFHKAGIQLNEAWGGFQLQLGLFVMPILTKLFGIITDKVIPAVRAGADAISGWLTKNQPLIDQLTRFGRVVLTYIVSGIRTVVGWVSSAITWFGTWMTKNKPLINQIRNTLAVAINAVATAITNVVTWIGTVVSTIANNKDAMNVLTVVWQGIGTAIGVARDAVADIIGWFAKFVDSVGKNKPAMDAFHKLWDDILVVLGAIVSTLTTIIDLADRAIKALAKIPGGPVNMTSNFYTKTGLGGSLPGTTTPYGGHPHKALGGPVMAGQPYTVGEKGIETFVPAQNGYIIPNGGGPRIIQLVVSGRVLAQIIDDEFAGMLGRSAPTLGRT